MKALVTGLLICTVVAGAALAEDMRGPAGGGNGARQNPWAQNSGVFLDVPWSQIMNGNNSGIPPKSDYQVHCSDVRHSCFGQFGVSEPGYGQCMAARGC
ncbi:hypothetical protein [Hyphomicrobium sp.]|uniref:hypothetical protein n=1 Tax=Hyphomicrobium sp. TaxID=82 RepID=UPI000FA7169C|nr:hypothetical protein [Hyphomicrobium sp.]RUO99279.1 MAG: hypothetical protein EKK30_08625 [Hyphomicrobium sp.]